VGFDYFGERFTAACMATGTSSFADFLNASAPHLLPGASGGPPAVGQGAGPDVQHGMLPHGTTIVAADFDGGVIMAGDRRSTAGSMIAQRDIEKVFRSDDYSCVGIAGVAGIGLELVRLFQLELEHYEKIEGSLLSLDGKANRLSTMLRGNLGMAMQGLAVVPVFAGYDLERRVGRIFSYDVTGGRYEEHEHHGVGSGSLFARGTLKKRWRPGLTMDEAVQLALESLRDAAEEDSATGGADLQRRIYPVVATVTAEGYYRLSNDDVAVADAATREGGDAR